MFCHGPNKRSYEKSRFGERLNLLDHILRGLRYISVKGVSIHGKGGVEGYAGTHFEYHRVFAEGGLNLQR
jgi:hypothetical protein